MTIERLLAEAAPKLRGLTLYPCEQGWQASITHDRQSWRVAISADPVAALAEALAERRPRPAPDPSNSVFD